MKIPRNIYVIWKAYDITMDTSPKKINMYELNIQNVQFIMVVFLINIIVNELNSLLWIFSPRLNTYEWIDQSIFLTQVQHANRGIISIRRYKGHTLFWIFSNRKKRLAERLLTWGLTDSTWGQNIWTKVFFDRVYSYYVYIKTIIKMQWMSLSISQ